jgi:hypothetical protein
LLRCSATHCINYVSCNINSLIAAIAAESEA